MNNQETFYSEELERSFDSIEELKQAVLDFYERDEFTSSRNQRRKGTFGKKKDGTKKYHFKK